MNVRDHIGDVAAFLIVARERSFTKAAAQLGLSQSRLSQTIGSLEKRLGVRLLTRTTRSVTPTAAGQHLLRTVGPRLEEIEFELAALDRYGAKPVGTVRIAATEHAAASVLWPKLQRTLSDFPDINVEVVIDYGLTDIVADGIDAGVRPGGMVAAGMIAVPIGPDMRMAVVASPDYLSRFGRPKAPRDLVHQKCINLRLPTHGGFYAWEFQRDTKEIKVYVEGQVVVNSAAAALSASAAGLGMAYLPEGAVKPYLETKDLVRVLTDWCAPFAGYHLYYPSRRQQSTAFGILLDALRYKR